MLVMNNTNFSFNANSTNNDGTILATMSANYWGQGVNFSLNIDNLANDDPVIMTDFAVFKESVMQTIGNMI